MRLSSGFRFVSSFACFIASNSEYCITGIGSAAGILFDPSGAVSTASISHNIIGVDFALAKRTQMSKEKTRICRVDHFESNSAVNLTVAY